MMQGSLDTFVQRSYQTDPHRASAQVVMDELLPGDLSAAVSEVEVEQNRTDSGHSHRHVTEVILIPGKVTLKTRREKSCFNLLIKNCCCQ